MERHHFVSYSRVTALDFALRLRDALETGPAPYRLWLDRRDLRPGDDWDRQIAEAISAGETLMFLMTIDSVEDQSICKPEWMRALKCKKPIIPMKLHADVELPFLLANREYIDFTAGFEEGLARLRKHMAWLASPAGSLHAMKHRLADAHRDLHRAASVEHKARIEYEIAELARQIEEQQRALDNPRDAVRRTEEQIAQGLARERERAELSETFTRRKSVNAPPGSAPVYFQDRDVETKLICDFLRDESKRLLVIGGRAGIGKTAIVCLVLKSLETGQLLDTGGPLGIAGIVYLSTVGSRRLSVANLYADLIKLLPGESARELEALHRNPWINNQVRMSALLAAFARDRIVLLLDNLEDVIDPITHHLLDAELQEVLRTVLNEPEHAVKVIVTTRIAPRDLLLLQPGRQTRLELDTGLESPYAENILREMDVDGTVGLRDAQADLLEEARRRTLGLPRALEALFAILSADRYTTLREVLNDSNRVLPEYVVEVLVGEAFDRLDPMATQVMEALAIYARPVPAAAVDYLLQPFQPGVHSTPVLNRLVTMHFVRKDADRYSLHPVDRAYAFARVPGGAESERSREAPAYTHAFLWQRGAEYFKRVRKAPENWKTVEDLTPQFAEFDLRCLAQDFDAAARVLMEFDFDLLYSWGYYRLMAELHERVQGRLTEPSINQGSVGNLGHAYYRMGRYQNAIAQFAQALQHARAMSERHNEGVWVCNLGLCYGDLGRTTLAVEYFELGLNILRENGDRQNEAIALGNIGFFLADLGEIARAKEYHQEALEIALEVNDGRGASLHRCNLGGRFAELGQTALAVEYCDSALEKTQEIGFRYAESLTLSYLGDAFADRAQWDKATEHYERAIQIADETGNAEVAIGARTGVALACISLGDYLRAQRPIAEAQRCSVPRKSYVVPFVLGLLALRQGDRARATEAFANAVALAEKLLTHSPRNSRCSESKGLALCGMALSTGHSDYVPAATEALRAARTINRAAGLVKRGVHRFDLLAAADREGALTGVRALVLEGALP